jgi:hypothetical protein
MDEREGTRLLAVLRVVVGAFLLLSPRRAGRMWTGDRDPTASTRIAVRGVGGRDLALGIGTLVAMDQGTDAAVRGWLEAGIVADATDAASTLLAWGELPPARAALLVASSAGACVLGWSFAQEIS